MPKVLGDHHPSTLKSLTNSFGYRRPQVVEPTYWLLFLMVLHVGVVCFKLFAQRWATET